MLFTDTSRLQKNVEPFLLSSVTVKIKRQLCGPHWRKKRATTKQERRCSLQVNPLYHIMTSRNSSQVLLLCFMVVLSKLCGRLKEIESWAKNERNKTLHILTDNDREMELLITNGNFLPNYRMKRRIQGSSPLFKKIEKKMDRTRWRKKNRLHTQY